MQRNYVTSSLDSIILKHEDAIKGVLEEMKQKAKQAQKPVAVPILKEQNMSWNGSTYQFWRKMAISAQWVQ